MATVYQRNGIYYAKFFDEHGKRTSRNTGVTKKREAQRIAAGMEADALSLRRSGQDLQRAYAVILEAAAREAQLGDLTLARAEEHLIKLRALANPSFRDITLKEAFSEWVEDQRPHVADSTILSYQDAQRRMLEAFGKKKANSSLNELTSEDVRNALNKVSQKVKASTANMDLGALRRVLESACGEGLLSTNVAKVVRPLPTTDSVERAPFTVEDVRKLIDTASSEELKGLILIAAHTGLRMGDVVSLSSKNIDGDSIVIRPKKTAKKKTTIRIPMTPPVMSWVCGRTGDFFPELSRKTKATLSTNFSNLMKRAGVDRKVTLPGGVIASRSFHSLRHSFTSWLADADVHSDIRRKLTGHKSASVHDLYTHHDESLARAIEQLPDFGVDSYKEGDVA